MKLAGKVAIVTGAARGIGKVIATAFAAEGAAVVLDDILIEQAQQAAEEIKKKGGRAIAVKADVANREEVRNLAKQTLDNFKAIHILVNNAAITRHAPLLEMTEEEWDAVIDVDLKGVFSCIQAVLEPMMEQRYGKIINIGSTAGIGGVTSFEANYAPAKAGVVALTKVAAVAGGPYGINVNCVAPGTVPTDITYTRRSKEEAEKLFAMRREQITIGRLGTPEDIANAVLFLASDESSYITGQVIYAGGGRRGLM